MIKEKQKISVIINTLNEEKNIEKCLKTVEWANDVVIVDMHSDDATVEIAKKYTKNIYYFERVGYSEPARRFALDRTQNEWVLLVDADELIPKELSLILIKIAAENRCDAVRMPRLNYLFGELIKHAGYGPENFQLRFFKKSKLSIRPRIHRFLVPADDAVIIDLSYKDIKTGIVHFESDCIASFLEKLNRYTSIEAAQVNELDENNKPLRKRRSKPYVLFIAAKTFFNKYISRKGYLDGWRGFYLSMFAAFYKIAVYAKIEEYEGNGNVESVHNKYDLTAQEIIRGYSDSE